MYLQYSKQPSMTVLSLSKIIWRSMILVQSLYSTGAWVGLHCSTHQPTLNATCRPPRPLSDGCLCPIFAWDLKQWDNNISEQYLQIIKIYGLIIIIDSKGSASLPYTPVRVIWKDRPAAAVAAIDLLVCLYYTYNNNKVHQKSWFLQRSAINYRKELTGFLVLRLLILRPSSDWSLKSACWNDGARNTQTM